MRKDDIQDKIRIMSNPKYRGKHLIMIAGKVFIANTGSQAAKLFDKVTKKYAGQTPMIAYVPKAETLILFYE